MEIKVQPLAQKHSAMLATFRCGVRSIDDYLDQAYGLQEFNLARIFIAVEAANKNNMVGYYAVHNMHIEADTMPMPFASMLRRGAMVGAVYVVMFAVDRRYHNQGIGTNLFRSALKRIKRIPEESGVWAVVLDALNDDAERFYRRFGFETLVSNTRRLYLPVNEIA